MKSYVVTLLVELPESSYYDWSEQTDVYISVLKEIDDGNAHMIELKEVPNNTVDKYTIFDEFGGV